MVLEVSSSTTCVPKAGDALMDRYLILEIIRRGSFGITCRAKDLSSGQLVFIKSIFFKSASDWKLIELFEREAHTLKQLSHYGIPRYFDSFKIETKETLSFHIVQEFIQGESLDERIKSSWKPQELEVRKIAREILEILAYLQSLNPPIIHRDIKPQNVILGKSGQLYLVDFGACRDLYRNTVTCGSTIVGTFGYMAPEQFSGKAEPATDLYGLGTTLLYLLTGESPADLPYRELKVDFSSIRYSRLKEVSKPFQGWLEALVEPNLDKRLQSAQVALDVLNGDRTIRECRSQRSLTSHTRNVNIQRDSTELLIEIPSYFSSGRKRKKAALTSILSWGLSFAFCAFLVLHFQANSTHSSLFEKIYNTSFGLTPFLVSFISNSHSLNSLELFCDLRLRASSQTLSLEFSLGSWTVFNASFPFSRNTSFPFSKEIPLEIVTDKQGSRTISCSLNRKRQKSLTSQQGRWITTSDSEVNQRKLFAFGLEQSEYVRIMEEVTDFVNESEIDTST